LTEPALNYTDQEIQVMNDWVGYLSYKPCFLLNSLLKCSQKIIMLNTGNQAGKNDAIAKHYVMRLLGKHPIEKKNMRPNTAIRVLRFAAQTLPMEPDGQGEVRNTVYPALKRRLPPGMIKKDVTIRKPVMTLYDPQGGPDIVVEFVSYGQQTQSQAGVQRWSVYLDETAPHDFFQEQLPRLLASGGDMVIGLTPLEGVTYLFEEVYQRAEIVYTSDSVIRYMKETHDKDILPIEVHDRNTGIAIIRCSTDDNPTFTKSQVDETMNQYDNEADYEIRRYGIFHQVSGAIYKEYDPKIHYISQSKYFPDGVPHDWLHSRGIDFHEHTNWACGWVALSKWNEAFVYR
jgi:phage terminase large subunit-like protein